MEISEAIKRADSHQAIYRKSWVLNSPRAIPVMFSSKKTGLVTAVVWSDKKFTPSLKELVANGREVMTVPSTTLVVSERR